MAAYPRADLRPNHCRSILTTNAVKARNALKSGHRYALCRDGDILLGFAACDYQHLVIRQRALQRLRLIPWHPHPHGREDDRHRLGMDRLNDRVRRRRQKAVDEMRPGIGFDLVPRSPSNSVQMPAKANSGRSLLSANHTTSFFSVSGLGSGAYSKKLLAGTRQRFSGFSQPRQ
jgi:hypothetical protein